MEDRISDVNIDAAFRQHRAVVVLVRRRAIPVEGINFACLGSIENVISGGTLMNIELSLAPLIALIAGILILIVPRLLSYIVAVYLIIIGVLGLWGGGVNLS
jgi:hypothetical protein